MIAMTVGDEDVVRRHLPGILFGLTVTSEVGIEQQLFAGGINAQGSMPEPFNSGSHHSILFYFLPSGI